MRLELYIRNRFYISEETALPEREEWMDLRDRNDFKTFCDAREEYVKLMIRGLLNKYARATENQEWTVRRVFESKMNQEIVLLN